MPRPSYGTWPLSKAAAKQILPVTVEKEGTQSVVPMNHRDRACPTIYFTWTRLITQGRTARETLFARVGRYCPNKLIMTQRTGIQGFGAESTWR